MHAHTYTGMHAHVRVPETMNGKFSAVKTWFGTNPTLSRICSKSRYIKPCMVSFQNTHKILRENTRFARNSESKRNLFTKKYSSQYFFIEAFSSLDLGVLRLLVTSLFDCE